MNKKLSICITVLCIAALLSVPVHATDINPTNNNELPTDILTVIKCDVPFQDCIPSVPQSPASAALISAKTIFFSAVLHRIPVSNRRVFDFVP